MRTKVQLIKENLGGKSFINDDIIQIISETEDILNSDEMTQMKMSLVEKNVIILEDILERRKIFSQKQSITKNKEEVITAFQETQVTILNSLERQGEYIDHTAKTLDSNDKILKEELSDQVNEVFQAVSTQTLTIKDEINKLSNDLRSVTQTPLETNAKIDEIAQFLSKQIPDEGQVIIESIRQDLGNIKNDNIDQYYSILEKLNKVYDAITNNGVQ
jgi:hypothetical protein